MKSFISLLFAQAPVENAEETIHSVEDAVEAAKHWYHDYLNWDVVSAFLGEWGMRIVAAALIFFIGKFLAKFFAKRVLGRSLQKMHMEATIADFLTSVLEWIILIFAIITAAGALKIPMTSFIAILGAAGLAVGLAFKNSMENFATGIMIITMKPFQAGDFIEAAGVSGTVKKIKIFHTILATPDNRRVTIPNGTIYAANIVNYSVNPTRRVDMTVSVSYNDDLKTAQSIIAKILDADPRVLKDPAPKIGVSDLADHGITIIVRPWVNKDDYWNVKFDVLEKMKCELEAAGLSIPFHQLDLHVIDLPKQEKN